LSVTDGLGAATQMLNIAGDVPNELLVLLSDGLGAHMRRHAFQYRTLIDKELFGIQRVKTIQTTVKDIVQGALVAAMIGVSNQVFAYLFMQLVTEDSTV
jgi:hypothetical protein